MKKITYYIAFLFLFLLGCTSDELANAIVTEESEISEIEAISLPFDFEGGDSRTAINMGSTSIALPVWRDGDTIGIYPSAGGDQLSFPIVEGINTNKCNFTGGGWALKASTATSTYKYTAYTPFNRSYYLLRDNTALPVSMLGQKQVGNDNSDHLGAYDLQIANGDTPTSGKISFSFQHKVAIVRMDITAPCAATWKSIELESNAAFTTKAAMNLSLDVATVTPTAQSNSVTLELENVKTTESDLSIVAYMMMLPVDFTNKTLSMKLTDTDDNVYTAPVTFRNPTNIANPRKFGEANPRWISAEFETEDKLDDPTPYVTFKANEVQTFAMSRAVETLEYSVNGGEWKPLGTITVPFGGNYGDLRLRGKNLEGTATGQHGYGGYYYSQVSFGNVVPVACVGDIRTLLDYENYLTVNTSRAKFCQLFDGCSNLTKAPELPATILADYCYYAMFRYCSNLTVAPKLPATSLNICCYYDMFRGCDSLTVAPELPATSLAESCYAEMFSDCDSLTVAPELPATILADFCYYAMFRYCSNLTVAPKLPATSLAASCYYAMFSDCDSLTVAPELPATSLAASCYAEMFRYCSNLTVAPKLPAMVMAASCYAEMFSACSNLTKAPELPATSLAASCYAEMFSGCTGLEEAPVLLPATILANYCYDSMFYDCSNLTKAPELPAMDMAASCYAEMFSGCRNLTKAPELPATILADFCYAEMFSGCTGLEEAPVLLPATILANYCYDSMFEGCTSLEEAPELPATSLTNGCYIRMFEGCTRLNKVTMLATDVSASSCLYLWLYRVKPTGTFIKSSEIDENSFESGSDGIPSGWTVVDYEE